MNEFSIGAILWVVVWAAIFGGAVALWNWDDKVENDDSPEMDKVRHGYGRRS